MEKNTFQVFLGKKKNLRLHGPAQFRSTGVQESTELHLQPKKLKNEKLGREPLPGMLIAREAEAKTKGV